MDPTPPGELITVGDRVDAPAVQGDLLGGGAFDETTTDGVVTVVNFWGSWCGPCRVEVPEFQELADANDDVAFLGIVVRDRDDLATAFLRDRGISYPSISDPAGELVSAFSAFPVTETPSTVLVDTDGRVAAAYLGPVSAEDLQLALDQLD